MSRIALKFLFRDMYVGNIIELTSPIAKSHVFKSITNISTNKRLDSNAIRIIINCIQKVVDAFSQCTAGPSLLLHCAMPPRFAAAT